jgi:hypothetical protein
MTYSLLDVEVSSTTNACLRCWIVYRACVEIKRYTKLEQSYIYLYIPIRGPFIIKVWRGPDLANGFQAATIQVYCPVGVAAFPITFLLRGDNVTGTCCMTGCLNAILPIWIVKEL